MEILSAMVTVLCVVIVVALLALVIGPTCTIASGLDCVTYQRVAIIYNLATPKFQFSNRSTQMRSKECSRVSF